MDKISWEDFQKVCIASGTIISAEVFKEANKPAYKIAADFGKYGVKVTSARVTDLYTPTELIGKQIIGVLNFPPKKIGPLLSEFLLTGFYRADGKVVLAVPDKEIENGSNLG